MKQCGSRGIQRRHKINVVQRHMTKREIESTVRVTLMKREGYDIPAHNLQLLGKTERATVVEDSVK